MSGLSFSLQVKELYKLMLKKSDILKLENDILLLSVSLNSEDVMRKN